MHRHAGIDSIVDSNWHRTNAFISFQMQGSPHSFYLWMYRDYTFLQPFFTWDLRRDSFSSEEKSHIEEPKTYFGAGLPQGQSKRKGREEEKDVSETMRRKPENKYQDVQKFIGRENLRLMLILLLKKKCTLNMLAFTFGWTLSFKGVKPRGSSSVVNRLSFSPCPRETPQVTKVVKWRNNTCYCRRGNEKRRGEVKSENKLCPISKSHRKSTSQQFQRKQNYLSWNMEKEDISCFPLP